jgi:acetate kinase
MHEAASHILIINGGSSSIKFALYEQQTLTKICDGKIDHLGMPGTYLTITNTETSKKTEEPIDGLLPITTLAELIQSRLPQHNVTAIGHRIVHGGALYNTTTIITDVVLSDLQKFSPLAPQHLPTQIAFIRAFQKTFPHIPHYASFDTAFHQSIPSLAYTLPIPRKYRDEGVRKYGYHGLSCEFLMQTLRETLPTPLTEQKIILAHLGNGSSLTAVSGGQSIETSMGFTPTSGVPMSTRSGDLDPGLFEYFTQSHGMSPDAFHHMVNFESGVLGISDTTADMEVLIKNAPHDAHAEEAVAFYAYHIKKHIGALSAVLGGVDVLVFSGGIGERGADVRTRICAGLEYLGIEIDASANETNSLRISSSQSRVILYVIPTDEELIMMQHIKSLLHAV